MGLQFSRGCFGLLFFVFTTFQAAYAVFELPHLSTPEQIEAFKTKLVTQASWVGQNPGLLQQIANGTAALVPVLESHPIWKDLVTKRLAPVTIFVELAQGTIRVEEVSAEIGATRGFLMQDCSKDTYAIAYSPQEYAYLVSNQENKPLAFIVGTSVLAEGKRTLFIHDFGGVEAKPEIILPVIHAFYQSLAELGFEQMTVSTLTGNNTGQWVATMNPKINQFKTTVAQKYLDAELRPIIREKTGIALNNTYDMPGTGQNAFTDTAKVFEPDANPISFRVRIVRNGVASHDHAVHSKPEAILRAINLYNANPSAGVTPEMLALEGIEATDLQLLFQKLQNAEHLTLAKYYVDLTELFAKFEIKLSRNFIREHDSLFREGHLNASDCTTTDDTTWLNRTSDYVVLALRQLPNPVTALDLIKKEKAFFENNKRFQNYLSSFSGRGANEANRIESLMALGFNFDFLREDYESLIRLAQSENQAIRHWAEELIKAHNCSAALTKKNANG